MRTRLLLATVAATVVLAGCSSETGTPTASGSADPTTTHNAPSDNQEHELEGIHACDLIAETELSE